MGRATASLTSERPDPSSLLMDCNPSFMSKINALNSVLPGESEGLMTRSVYRRDDGWAVWQCSASTDSVGPQVLPFLTSWPGERHLQQLLWVCLDSGKPSLPSHAGTCTRSVHSVALCGRSLILGPVGQWGRTKLGRDYLCLQPSSPLLLHFLPFIDFSSSPLLPSPLSARAR